MKRRAFTIIEVLISIIILAITLAGGASIYFYLSALTAQATHKDIAVQLANSKMEEYKRIDCDALVQGAIYPPDIMIGNISFHQTVTIGDDLDPNSSICYRSVIVQVTWTDPSNGIDVIVDLTTYM